MIYSHDYTKLQRLYYTTIRRYNKGYKVGDIITERYPSGQHKAKIMDIKKETLDNLSNSFLYEDTDCLIRENVYKLFQTFYKKPIDFEKEKFYVFYLKKVALTKPSRRVDNKLFTFAGNRSNYMG